MFMFTETSMLGVFMDGAMKEGMDVKNSALGSMAVGASPRDCAFALIRSTALRETKPYFPDTFMNRATVIFGKIFPELNKQVLRLVADGATVSKE